MHFTKFTDYSLRVLIYLALHQDKLCTVKEISNYYNISQNHLVKIVYKLSILGYLKSHKGKNGGIAILKQPNEINLKDFILDIESNFFLVECFNKEKNTCCIQEICSAKSIFTESLTLFINNLSKYTLADVLEKKKFMGTK